MDYEYNYYNCEIEKKNFINIDTERDNEDEEWYQQSIALQQYSDSMNYTKQMQRKKYNQIPNYDDSFQITCQNDILVCNWGTLNSDIKIKDIIVEGTIIDHIYDKETSEYLIALIEGKSPILLARYRVYDEPDTIDYDSENLIRTYRCLNDSFKRINFLGYFQIKNRQQMRQILSILNQKIVNPHGHFHYANEQFIYQKIFSHFLPWNQKQINTYLKNRNDGMTDIYNENNDHTLKLRRRNCPIPNTELFELIEYYEGNYIEEDATIIDASIKIIGNSPTRKSIYVKYRTKENRIKKLCLCEFVINHHHHDISTTLSTEDMFRYFKNVYAYPFSLSHYNIYAFYILPCNEIQIEQIADILHRKKEPFEIFDLLRFSCKEGFSTLEPNPTQREEIIKKLEEAKAVVIQHNESGKLNQAKVFEEQLLFHLKQIEILTNSMKQLQSASFKLPKIFIQSESLIIKVNDHLEINPIYANYLQYIDLASIDFKNVKVSGLNFSNTNVTWMDPQTVYQKDMSHGNYQGINFLFKSFKGVNIIDSTFDNEYDYFKYDFSEAIQEELKIKEKRI